MAETYTQLVAKVRDWSNRDAAALPDTVIMDALQWAVDKAYRTLRVPPLENIVTYNATTLIANTSSSSNVISSVTTLAIPGDLIEFIMIREVDSELATTRMFNEKADVRTFRDQYSERYSDFAIWTREAGNILLSPGFGSGGTNSGSLGSGPAQAVQLYYYRRLPALDATYDVSLANYRLGLLRDASGAVLPLDATYTQAQFDALPSTTVGGLVPNWFREQNERIALFGALGECFAYLQEDDQAQKFGSLFYEEIKELNNEDVMRNASGGNVQMNFNGRGLI